MTADQSAQHNYRTDPREGALETVRAELDAVRVQVVELQQERQEMRDHRTQVRTLLSLAGAAAAVVVIGAVTVRDTTLATAARSAVWDSVRLQAVG